MKFAKTLVLVRHGESTANVDRGVMAHTANCDIPLTQKGKQQAYDAGRIIANMILDYPSIYVSPYLRTRQTASELYKSVKTCDPIEDIRLREIDVGNFVPNINEVYKEREAYNKFFYRFPNGESCADVYIRVKQFLSEMPHRDTIIVTHAATMRVFAMILNGWDVERYCIEPKPTNGEILTFKL